jgi:hypothetical protein
LQRQAVIGAGGNAALPEGRRTIAGVLAQAARAGKGLADDRRDRRQREICRCIALALRAALHDDIRLRGSNATARPESGGLRRRDVDRDSTEDKRGEHCGRIHDADCFHVCSRE